jgi:hypothetical protein
MRDPMNPFGPILRQFNTTIARLEEIGDFTPDQIDDALTHIQRTYRDERGLPSQGRAAFVRHRGKIGSWDEGPADL